MAKGSKRVPKKAPAAPVHEPRWDKATWMSLANVRLGVQPFVVAGALHAHPDKVKLTEADVRKCINDFLGQSL